MPEEEKKTALDIMMRGVKETDFCSVLLGKVFRSADTNRRYAVVRPFPPGGYLEHRCKFLCLSPQTPETAEENLDYHNPSILSNLIKIDYRDLTSEEAEIIAYYEQIYSLFSPHQHIEPSVGGVLPLYLHDPFFPKRHLLEGSRPATPEEEQHYIPPLIRHS